MTQPSGWDAFDDPNAASGVTPALATAPAATTAPAPAEPADTRQAWVCVEPSGPRTRRRPAGSPPDTAAVVCPVFRSDAHLAKELVRCPNCGGWSVRKAEPGEV